MTIRDVINELNCLAPFKYAEEFDNVGLLVGNANSELKGILVSHDATKGVVEEAVNKNCNLIVCFHPILFKGLKSITGKNYVEQSVIHAIKNDISIVAIHTALDNNFSGVNDLFRKALELEDPEILIPKTGTIKKLVTYVPIDSIEKVKTELFNAGAGAIGNYDHCSFVSDGIGSFRGNDISNPTYGTKGEIQHEKEKMLSVTFHQHLESKVLKSLFNSHPYEEVAYEITTLENTNQKIGLGMVGRLSNEMTSEEFLNHVKNKLGLKFLRHSANLNKKISKVAVLGGSGSFAIPNAKSSGVEAFVTADLKYHDFFSAENEILLIDAGHFETEQFIKSFLFDYLSKKITNFAPALSGGKVILSTTNTNPVKYF
ncbi:Nif3-like dinuclear metal center hexameric protein [Aegicerativicinus sediminis]|uniref:Nif3-like dinuclear metal center hexameric protein n=1 Tax=Aegicerativicinus sediminis TaxID=2893202 RepID=UPI001E4B36FB|nr:Nif3-like dinuclear metal center hexameric protein [Aegicerativicinus sediminis]